MEIEGLSKMRRPPVRLAARVRPEAWRQGPASVPSPRRRRDMPEHGQTRDEVRLLVCRTRLPSDEQAGTYCPGSCRCPVPKRHVRGKLGITEGTEGPFPAETQRCGDAESRGEGG
jgi:hypothetical protein